MKIFNLVALVAAILLGSQAHARPFHRGLGGLSLCPMGSGLVDGCAQSVGGTFLAVATPSQWSAYARTSGQTWAGGTHPWSWNAPGIDYAIGPYTAIASLKDPTVQANLPSGCTYQPTGTTLNGPRVFCDSVANLTVSGFDFGPNGSHGCVQLVIGSNASITLTISNNRFKNGTNCSITEATFVGALNGTSPTKVSVSNVVSGSIVVGDSFQGGPLDTKYTITANNGDGTYNISSGRCLNATPCPTTSMTFYEGKAVGDIVHINQPQTNITDVEFVNNTFDGDGVNFPITLGQFINTGTSSGTVRFQYNSFLRMPTRPINIPAIGTLVMQYNYFEDFCYSGVDGHCEPWVHLLNDNQTQALQQVSYNVFLQGKTGVFPGGTGLVWLGSSIGSGTDSFTTNTQFDHNILVANCVPNGPGGEGENSGASVCNISDGANVLSSAHDVEAQDLTYGNMNLSSNFIDGTGVLTKSAILNSDTFCTNAPVWAGNVNLVSGASITGWDSNGANGC